VFPQTIVQTCIVHLIRNSLAFVSWKDRKAILPAIKAIYRAESDDIALVRLEEFEAKWGKRYPAIAQAWRRAWEYIVPFFAFAPGVRKMIYTTDEIDKQLFVNGAMLWKLSQVHSFVRLHRRPFFRRAADVLSVARRDGHGWPHCGHREAWP
jgi:hypothetical protein